MIALESEREELRRTFETETEQHKRESKDVRMQLFSVQNELAEKKRALSDFESRLAAESKVHQEALAKIDELGQQLETNVAQSAAQSEQTIAQAARIKELEGLLAGERSWTEQHKRECAAVQDRLSAVEAELAAKATALSASESKCVAEEKLHKKFSADAYNLGRRVAAQALRIKELEDSLAGERSWEKQHRRECVAVQDRLAVVEAELMAKSKALVEAETKSANEEKLHRKFSSEAYNLTKEKVALVEKVQKLTGECNMLRQKLTKVSASYEKLAKAKLGRLTLAYWRFKDRRKK